MMPGIFGGASVRAEWNPKRIHTNLVCDLDTRYVDATGSICTRVFDQVSGTHAFQQASGLLRPLIERSGWSPGVDRISHDGQRTRLENNTSLASTIMGNDFPATIYFVGTVPTGSSCVLWSLGSSASANPLFYPIYLGGNQHISGVKRDTGGVLSTVGASVTSPTGSKHVYAFNQTGTSLEVLQDATTILTGSQNVGAVTYNQAAIGCRFFLTTRDTFSDWKWVRMLWFNASKQGTVEHQVLQSALCTMYGLTNSGTKP